MKTLVSTLILSLFAGASASAQSVAPMNKDISSFSDTFMFQVNIKNTYKTGQVSEIQLYDLDWTPIDNGYVSHKSAFLGAGQKLIVTAMVPFDGREQRQIYLCHVIAPRFGIGSAKFKGEVCGKYIATRLS